MSLDLNPRQLSDETILELAPANLFSLKGKTALVTGASGGIGQWLAAALAAAGASVVATDLRAPANFASRLSGLGLNAVAVAGDLANRSTPRCLVRDTVEEFGQIDVVVNNAGVNKRQPALEVDTPSWDLISQINLRAPFDIAREAAQQMISQKTSGSIINMCSLTNSAALGNVSVYGMHKAAISQMGKSLALEWSSHNIRVNCIAPGMILTPLTRSLWDVPVTRQWLLDRIPMRRPGSPSELVGACLLLASHAGSYINGQTLNVEGGFLAGTDWTRTVDDDGNETLAP